MPFHAASCVPKFDTPILWRQYRDDVGCISRAYRCCRYFAMVRRDDTLLPRAIIADAMGAFAGRNARRRFLRRSRRRAEALLVSRVRRVRGHSVVSRRFLSDGFCHFRVMPLKRRHGRVM